MTHTVGCRCENPLARLAPKHYPPWVRVASKPYRPPSNRQYRQRKLLLTACWGTLTVAPNFSKGGCYGSVGGFFVCTRIYLCLMVPHFHVNFDHTCFTNKNDVFCVFSSSYWNLLIFNRGNQQTTDTQSFLSKVKHLQQPVGPRRDRSEVESLKSRIRAAQEEALWIFSGGEG